MPFFLDGNPSQGEISEAVNYLLSNFSQSVVADPSTGQIVGPAGDITGYLYKYISIKYSDSFDGTLNFSNSPTNRYYYGIRNTDSSTESTNPADYVWYHYTAGFSTTLFLWYIITGGRQISFQVSATQPNPGWVQDGGTTIDLDYSTTAVSSPANFVVIRVANSSAAPTNAEVLAAIGRLPIDGDLCIVNYNSGIYSLQYKYNSGWAIFQKVITGDLVVASSIVGSNIAANTITATNIQTNSITVNEINNIAVGQIIAGSFNFVSFTSIGSTTWTVPAYVYKVKVTCVGGGGGGYNVNNSTDHSGGGGGAGSIKVVSVTPGDNYTVTVGSGGAIQTAGGNSSFVGTGANVVARGGASGVAGPNGNSFAAGGVATGGDININGASSAPIYAGGLGGAAPFIGTFGGPAASAQPNSGGGGIGRNALFGVSAQAGGSGLVLIEY